MAILLDLNNQVFQDQWFRLEKDERNAVLQSCVKLAALSWDELYRDKGFRGESIQSRRAADGSKLAEAMRRPWAQNSLPLSKKRP
jgi:hypothetical protein